MPGHPRNERGTDDDDMDECAGMVQIVPGRTFRR